MQTERQRRRPVRGPRPTKQTKNSFIGGPVPREVRNAVLALAEERGVSISAILREVLEAYVQEQADDRRAR